MIRIAGLVTALVFFCFPQPAFSGSYSIKLNRKIYKGAAVYNQGEVIKLQVVSKSPISFKVTFNGKEYLPFLYGKYQTVLIGIDYQLKPGIYDLIGIYELQGLSFSLAHRIRVKEKYPPLKNTHLIRRDKKELEKVRIANKQKAEIFYHPSPVLNSLPVFTRPVPWRVTNGFGQFRYCQDILKKKGIKCRYHLGTDYLGYDTKKGKSEKVSAINDGRVIFADENEIDGKMIVIDHGNDIYSGYLHLSEFFVKGGALVRRGEAIGVVGSSGTNSIHLHFFIKMDSGVTTVDPESFFQQVVR